MRLRVRLLITIFNILVIICSCQQQLQQQQPDIVRKALRFAESKENRETFHHLDKSSASTLYKIAKIWLETGWSKESWELVQYLADDLQHVPSLAKLGHKYADEGKTQRALAYFQQAGENGPHHASLYNAGRILAQPLKETGEPDWVGALAYLKAAATLHLTHPKFAQESITNISQEAYRIVSQQASTAELSIKESADVFLYGSLHDLPERAETLWKDAIISLLHFNETFVATNGRNQDAVSMQEIANSLRQLWEQYSSLLTPLQAYLLLDHMNDMLGPLAGLDDSYLAMAAGYAEALANSPYCVERYAVSETDPACFNGAAASAMSYYRRAGDTESAQRILELGRAHPQAATHWDSTLQTPRVYHPELQSKPWWNPAGFSAATRLTQLYQNDESRNKMLQELESVKKLQEGRLRGMDLTAIVEVDASGHVSDSDESSTNEQQQGLQRIFTPYIGLRSVNSSVASEGAGIWSEFGPLFDGKTWHSKNCQLVPSICQALQNDRSLCTARATEGMDVNVWEICGSDTVVTLLRLLPGSSILPHCGTSNARLILHFPLVGADGIEFTVGEETVTSYGGGNGHAIVFDDSYEHSVYHGGMDDRYVVLAVLAHPQLLH
jgi:tetratricopeptide (TPR) repeat protein